MYHPKHSRRPERTTGLAVALSLLLGLSRLSAQGFPPAEAAKRMEVAAGLEVRLVASEPLVRQPVAIEFDDRGRLWVIQYLQYPHPAGLTPVEVDRYSRTRYDRVPEPPPRGPRGADRITILEDPDGDGLCDRGQDFVDGLSLATSLAFGEGGVFVLQAPYLLFYPDQDGDDRPDSDPRVLLEGFGMEDAHSVANSLTWGPDGWLYGLQGSTVTARIRGIEFQQGVWRYRPRTGEFELFAEGGGNMWGLDFDADGELLASTNVGGHTLLHALPGGCYWKSFAKHGPLHRPFALGHLEHAPCPGFHGGHVTVGGIVYQEELLPEEFRGAYLYGDLLEHCLRWHRIDREGSTVRSGAVKDLVLARDTWFAPTDLTVGPDGAIYFADWHDRRTAHPDPDADWDRTNGRIFRLAPRGAPGARDPGLAGRTDGELIEALCGPGEWRPRRARRLLVERLAARPDPASIARLREEILAPGSDPRRALGALWALGSLGPLDDALARRLLEDPREQLRRWAARFRCERGSLPPAAAAPLLDLARSESSPVVLAEIAAGARRLPAGPGLSLAQALLLNGRRSEDPCLPLLLWWAVERHALEDVDRTLALVATPGAWKVPLAADEILPRLMQRFVGDRSGTGDRAAAGLLALAPAGPSRARMIRALSDGFPGPERAPGGPGHGTLLDSFAAPEGGDGPSEGGRKVSPVLKELFGSFYREDPLDRSRCRLAVLAGTGGAEAATLARARDRALPRAARLEALEILAEGAGEETIAALADLLGAGEDPELERAALAAVERSGDPRMASRLLDRSGRLDRDLRLRLHEALLRKRAWARELLVRVRSGEVRPEEVPIAGLRAASLHQDAEIDRLILERWGVVRPGTPEEKLAEVRRLKNDLRAGAGDAREGRKRFAETCAGCHRLFGEGEAVGPDLTSANRFDPDWLLVAIVDPGAHIRREFLSLQVRTRDGRILVGLPLADAPDAITIFDAKRERVRIGRAEVASVSEAAVSLMPEDLLRGLKPEAVRDLFAYLTLREPPGETR